MAVNVAENTRAQAAQLRLAIGEVIAQGTIRRGSLYYFQDRLDVYMDTYTARYGRLGQTYNFREDPNVQHFEFMIAQETASIEALKQEYLRLKALLED